MIDHYDWAGGREAMLRFGPSEGPVVAAALPLFEEANRTRAFVVTILRLLAERGIGSALPDLPGQGESLLPTGAVRLPNLRAAFAAAARAAGARHAVAIRSGALLDTEAVLAGRWHFAPQSSSELLRELDRVRRAGSDGDVAGNILAPELLTDLDNAGFEAARVLRHDSDPRDAAARVPGAPLWRRAEPENDFELAALLADDIAAWVRTSLPLPSGEGRGPPPKAVGRVRATKGEVSRKLIPFPCAGETLLGTLDAAPDTTGLLIVSGGNEIRIGAHRGMALLAQRVAGAGHPVFRFDRRGIGDSTGENRGYESSAEDIAAAATAFRTETGVARIVAFGNCDAATALAFFHAQAGIDALVLANPWAIEASDDLPPAAAIRARYAERMRDPRQWLRLLTGGINIVKLVRGLKKASETRSEQSNALPARLAQALAEAQVPVTILLAERDNTAIAFADALESSAFDSARAKTRFERLDSASHSFASQADKDWLYDRILAALAM